jgi:integrase
MSNRHRTGRRVGIAERNNANGTRSFRGTVYDKATGKQLRGPWTPHLAEARAWRVDALARLQAGTLSGDRGPTVREAVDRFVDGINDGSIRTRSGHRYKPSTRRGYERDLRGRVLSALGPSRLGELTLPDLQRWADRLPAEGLSPASVRNVVNSIRAVYAWALPRGLARTNPTTGLRLPTGEKARDRIATPSEASALIGALLPHDQAALGLAVYAGLRLGELLALEWSAINLDAGVLRVERAWDHGGE